MSSPQRIRITDVGPRDGLQNEPEVLGVDTKVRFIELLAESGVAEIEASSFVSPKWIPQLGDAEEVFRKIERWDGVVYSALVPNEKGLERALALGPTHRPDKIAIFTAASETFSHKNTNATIAETLERFKPVIVQAKAAGMPMRAYISCAVACPYEGPIDPGQVRDVVAQLLDLGLNVNEDDIDLGETIGVAVPSDIERLYDGLSEVLTPEQTTLHLHDTRGTALACAYRAMQLGVWRFDASCAGLGGCPYAPNATGNLATEDLVYLCEKMGLSCGVDLKQLFAAGRYVRTALRRGLPGRVFNADGGST